MRIEAPEIEMDARCCPTLSELPPPPAGKTGWPWTQESSPLPDKMPDGSPWPRISIVTPSYNQGQFIEETIRSVLLQGYANLEYIIIDGGSTDNSVEIIRKYEQWISYWISEPDSGQADAINKGWKQSNGETLAWINSDDFYVMDAFATVAGAMQCNPDVAFIYGGCDIVNEEGKFIRRYIEWDYDLIDLIRNWASLIPQPSTFVRREQLFAVGMLDTTFSLAMDYDLWLRLSSGYSAVRIPQILSIWRYYTESKTQKFRRLTREETVRAYQKLKFNPSISTQVYQIAQQAYLRGLMELSLLGIREGCYVRAVKLGIQAAFTDICLTGQILVAAAARRLQKYARSPVN